MRWKVFAVAVSLFYVWDVVRDIGAGERSAMAIIGTASVWGLAVIGLLLYAFERELLSCRFWRWVSRVYLVWICVFSAFMLLAIAMSAERGGMLMLLALGACCVRYFVWLALSRQARGETLR